MEYKYSYSDWFDGTIIWNDIISHETDKYYISNNCREKIKKRQKAIFSKLTKAHLHTLINGLKLEIKSSINNQEIVDSHLETVHNLFDGVIDDFEDTEVILYNIGAPDSYSVEIPKKQIPPLMVTNFDKSDIERIRASKFEYFKNKGVWNYSVIESPDVSKLDKYVDYQAEVWASAYYEFRILLSENRGNFKNTASFGLEKHQLRLLRNKLIENNFIVKTNAELFLRILSGTFLYEEEKITWNTSISSLNYLISELEYFNHYFPKGFGKWDCIVTFFMQLTRHLQQSIGTIPAINLNKYLENIGEKVDEHI